MKPILFNTEMVRAILSGNKNATRRCAFANKDIREFRTSNYPNGWWFKCRVFSDWAAMLKNCQGPLEECKYKKGDILYARECFYKDAGRYMYRADYSDNEKFYMNGREVKIKWKPSIHMPKEAARIFLRVTNVSVERLQDITVEQAEQEGVGKLFYEDIAYDGKYNDIPFDGYHLQVHQFARLWDSTVKRANRDSYGWEANPWVWVYDFERITKEEAYNDY